MYDHPRQMGSFGVHDDDAISMQLQRCLQALDGARAIREQSLQDEVVRLRRQWFARFSRHNLLGKNPRMQGLFGAIDNLGSITAPVLIEGEAGTGKQQLACAIHEASVHRQGRFVAIRCASQPTLELQTALALAQHGSLFLGEIGNLPTPLQSTVVTWLREVGTPVRFLAGSRKPLQRLARQGAVAQELWNCLRAVRIALPPLRQRPEDIVLLAQHFAGKYAPPGQRAATITAAALERLLTYRWPGNVRELEIVMQRACQQTRGNFIDEQHLPVELAPTHKPIVCRVTLDRPLPNLLRDMTATIERQYLRKALQRVHGNVVRAARICGLSRRSVTAKIAAYGIDRVAFKKA
jgi:DNA-binding NtrC family response regulator